MVVKLGVSHYADGCLTADSRVLGENSRTKAEAAIKLRKLHNDDYVSHTISPYIVDVIKSRRIRWVGHVASTGEKWNAYRVLVSKIEGKGTLRNLGIDVRTILTWILKKYDGSAWIGVMWFKVGTCGEILYVGNEMSGAIKVGITWLDKEVRVSEDGPCCMTLVHWRCKGRM